MLIFAGLFWVNQLGAKEKPTETNADFWIISDNHLLARSLHDDGKAFQQIAATTAGKDIVYNEEILEALVQKALIEKPDVLILTGDVTLNGELISLQALNRIFAPLKEAEIPVLAIPGNHDIFDGWARSFIGDKQQVIEQISTDDFEKYLPDGFDLSISRDSSSLSYTVDFGTYRLFMMDSNLYTIEKSHMAPITAGRFKDETISWLDQQLQACQNDGQQPIVFMHHNLLQHNERIHDGYVLNNAAEVIPLMKKYQVPLVFSGHIHVQDIMEDSKNGFYEITSSSFSIAKTQVGHLHLSPNKISYQAESFDPTSYLSTAEKNQTDLQNYPNYIQQLFMEDGKRMAYQNLFGQDIYEDEIVDPIADFVGQANLRYFTGNNNLSAQEIAAIKAEPGYALLEKYDQSLLKYVESTLVDPNTPDNLHLEIDLTDK